MTAMPDKMGPFEYVSADGELYPGKKPGTYVEDGKPDGQAEFDEELMSLLKIGTPTDTHNLPLRQSNWLSVRIYRDTRRPVGDPLRYWRLEVYYYTGGVDLVPHVPEKCAVASGADWMGTTPLPVVLPGETEPWGPKPLPLRRALFSKTDGGYTQQFLQYYIFSFNGRPMYDRNQVRWALGNLFVKHAYFAKIQFAPLPVPYWAGNRLAGQLPDPAEADKGAADFAEHFMPSILKMLPMPQEIARLDAGAGDAKE